jgi:TolB-like protein
MASLYPGFEYDIFISYRHNDNRSGWVSDFVDSLKEELSATIKDPLSIYFDKNPEDGLLESHDVDKSLEGKLKCLIFIPIISQTYCDPKSFAWKHEFCAFNKLAKEDEIGRDIKLVNGNVTSRILPIKIHDLDAEDKRTIEAEINGALRAIEFIYKSAGVNRPLRANEDRQNDNLNKTLYRDQINKTANAIKEIITAIKNPSPQKSITDDSPRSAKSISKRSLAGGLAALALIFAIWFFYLKINSSDAAAKIDKSIAVLPFVDMSAAHDQEYFGDGVAEEVINVLSQAVDLKVIARSSSFQFKGKNEDLRTIGKMLDVATVLEGSIRKSADQIRITAQLIKTSDGTHLWSKTFDRSSKDIFAVQDEIAQAVASALKTTLSEVATSNRETTWNDEARKEYQLGRYYYDRRAGNDLDLALIHFKKSIAIDSSNAIVYAYLSVNCVNVLGGYGTEGEKRCNWYLDKALQLDATQPDVIAYNAARYLFDLDFYKSKEEMDKALRYGPQNPTVLRNAGRLMSLLGERSEAIRIGELSVAVDPLQTFSFVILSWTYARAGRYEDAIKTLKKARALNNDHNDELALWYLLNEQIAEAIEENNQALGGRHDFQEILIQYKLNHQDKAASLLETFMRTGEKDAFFTWRCAQAAAYIGKKELAFTWLEKCFQEKVSRLAYIKDNPLLISLVNDPRYADLITRMKFPDN